jgi:hypothetical protein
MISMAERDNVALSQPLEDGEQLHPVPNPVKTEIQELGRGRILELTSMHNDRSRDGYDEHHRRDYLIRTGDLAGYFAAKPANERSHRERHDNADVGGEESFRRSVVSVAVARAGQGQITVGPIKPEGHAHQQSGHPIHQGFSVKGFIMTRQGATLSTLAEQRRFIHEIAVTNQLRSEGFLACKALSDDDESIFTSSSSTTKRDEVYLI